MDFKGQILVEQIYQLIIFLFGLAGVATGYFLQSFKITLCFIAVGVAIAAVVCLPDWPFYNRNPLKWLQSVEPPKQQTKTKTGKKKK